ncbi:MAG: hypothetical protein GY932_11170, partial [Arcobacter sp.]|nr:hypothetical protein [Arcobacter sp.]
LFSSDPEFYNNKEEDKMAHPGMNNFKKGYSPTIIALIIAFFIVGSIGIYYLFFDNPTWLYDQNEVEVNLSEKHAKEFEEAKKRIMAVNTTSNSDSLEPTKTNETTKNVNDKPIVKNEDLIKEKITKKTEAKEIEKAIIDKVKKSNSKTTVIEPKKTTTKPKATNTVLKSKTSKEVNNNIFFDGTNYSVQISSWKQQSIAEQEVTRLKKKGYSA